MNASCSNAGLSDIVPVRPKLEPLTCRPIVSPLRQPLMGELSDAPLRPLRGWRPRLPSVRVGSYGLTRQIRETGKVNLQISRPCGCLSGWAPVWSCCQWAKPIHFGEHRSAADAQRKLEQTRVRSDLQPGSRAAGFFSAFFWPVFCGFFPLLSPPAGAAPVTRR